MQELKYLISLLAQGVKSGEAIAQDGKIDVSDIPYVFTFLQKVPAAVSGISKVPAEISALDEASLADVLAFTMSELSLDEGKAKQVVEASIKAGLSLFELGKVLLAK